VNQVFNPFKIIKQQGELLQQALEKIAALEEKVLELEQTNAQDIAACINISSLAQHLSPDQLRRIGQAIEEQVARDSYLAQNVAELIDSNAISERVLRLVDNKLNSSISHVTRELERNLDRTYKGIMLTWVSDNIDYPRLAREVNTRYNQVAIDLVDEIVKNSKGTLVKTVVELVLKKIAINVSSSDVTDIAIIEQSTINTL
jgi:hypothetical protein